MNYLAILAVYIIGSIPFGYIMTRLLKKVDIRAYGSGNIGATNVLRVLGWPAALFVFFLDGAKGVAAVLLAGYLSDLTAVRLAAGLAVLLGHSFPVFLRFKGGKGAATGIGVLFALGGWVAPVVLLFAGAIIAATRYVSLGSILGALSLPLLFWLFGFEAAYIYFGAFAALLVILRHHANIGRLIRGTETKLGQKINPAGEGKS
ncbi:MAG: glycerol-3-phosphate 1-O-acyltransferase PlsY [Bacillota bacterium]